MNRLLREELSHIPRVYGDLYQSLLRSAYNAYRRHGLKFGWSKEQALAKSIEVMTRERPGWKPTYDVTFFDLS